MNGIAGCKPGLLPRHLVGSLLAVPLLALSVPASLCITLTATLTGTLAMTLASSPASAQQQLSVEELEAYIAAQKAALDKVRANRKETEKKVQEIQEALTEQGARRARVEQELETLCKEQEELKPGTYDDCRAQSDS
jgi:septal ring factor EnvC (AmiA/AmiB activator)